MTAHPATGPLWFFKRWALPALVTTVEYVAPRMQRVEIVGEQLTGRDWTPGQQVRVMFKDMTQIGPWLAPRDFNALSRTYSLWNYDPAAGRYELIVFDHDGDGPGRRWAQQVQAGDRILVSAPEGKFVSRLPSRYHLFVGEETAAVCFGAMLRVLPPSETVVGAVEAESTGDHLRLPRHDDLRAVERNGGSASPSQALLRAVEALALPDEPGTAYLAGEAKTIQAVRRHLIHERSWPRTSILTKPFWTPGKRGLD